MARLPRLVIAHQPHHIIQQGNDGQLIFRAPEDYQQFLVWLKECAKEAKVAIHAYVLMPNHFHLLATPATEAGLAQMMQRLGRYYVPWYNARYQRSGGLFTGRFKTSLIDAESYFLKCSLFVELNPVRTEGATDPASYPWSSYHHHAGIRIDPVITDHALYWALGNTPFQREARYQELARERLPEAEHARIEAAVVKGWPLASAAYQQTLQESIKRRVLPARRGRPRKTALPSC
ncbi:MAG: transposase [Gammaproteobacteria bacterium]